MGDLPAAGIISGVDVVKDRVRLREEFTKGVNVGSHTGYGGSARRRLVCGQ